MRLRTLDSRRTIESCTLKLHSWRPFDIQTTPKTVESDTHYTTSKKPCLSDRTTSFPIDAVDVPRLILFDDYRSVSSVRLTDRKRRRSNRSGTRRRGCSFGDYATYATCSDFPVAAGTDSSGELFLNGGGYWASEAAKGSRRERDGGTGERDHLGCGFGLFANCDNQGIEPGYRGDTEFGYGNEVDEEEEDQSLVFWGEKLIGTPVKDSNLGRNTVQKVHRKRRRKEHERENG